MISTPPRSKPSGAYSTPVLLEVEDLSWQAPVLLKSSSRALNPQEGDAAPSHGASDQPWPDDCVPSELSLLTEDRTHSTRFPTHPSNHPLIPSKKPSPDALAPTPLLQLDKPLPPLPGHEESTPREGLLSSVPHTAHLVEPFILTCDDGENVRQQHTATEIFDVTILPSFSDSTLALISRSPHTPSILYSTLCESTPPAAFNRSFPNCTTKYTSPTFQPSPYHSSECLTLSRSPTPGSSTHEQDVTLLESRADYGEPQESTITPDIPPPLPQADIQVWDPHVLPSTKYLGTEVVQTYPHSEYNPTDDLIVTTEACRFPETQKTLMKLLFSKNGEQIRIIRRDYSLLTRRRLVTAIEQHVTGPCQDGLLLLIRGPLAGDAYLLEKAQIMSKTERLTLLTEICIARDATELALLEWYIWVMKTTHLKDIVHQLLAEIPCVLPLFDAALSGPVANTRSLAEQLNNDYDVLEQVFTEGIDDPQIYEIILQRSPEHLRRLCARHQRYESGQTVASRIKIHFKDPYIRYILFYAIQSGEVHPRHKDYGDGIWRDMRRIMNAMLTHEELYWRLIRAHWDQDRFRRIMQALISYNSKKGSPLGPSTALAGMDYKTIVKIVLQHSKN